MYSTYSQSYIVTSYKYKHVHIHHLQRELIPYSFVIITICMHCNTYTFILNTHEYMHICILLIMLTSNGKIDCLSGIG